MSKPRQDRVDESDAVYRELVRVMLLSTSGESGSRSSAQPSFARSLASSQSFSAMPLCLELEYAPNAPWQFN